MPVDASDWSLYLMNNYNMRTCIHSVQNTMAPIKDRARSFPIFFYPAYPSFHLHFLVDERTISGVDLLEMTL